jgi:hypothetical protein
MDEKRHLSKVSWPPTLPFYLHHLHHALRQLIDDAERFAKRAPGRDPVVDEQSVWLDIYAIEELLRIRRSIPDDPEHVPNLWNPETWLRRILSELPVFDRQKQIPATANDHARRLASAPYLDALRGILEMIRDPFDCPHGMNLQIFEWVRYHAGVDPAYWNFEAKVPEVVWKRWSEAFCENEGPREALETKAIRLKLIADAGFLRDPIASQAVPGFACSKAELLRALGKDRSNKTYLEQLSRGGMLELTTAANSVGYARYLARFTDPLEHARVVAAIEKDRKPS